jgi:nucleoside-diphosphate-sugar epimerase
MRLFRECLEGAAFAIHLAEAKTKERDFDAKNIKSFGLLLEAAAEAQSLQRFVFVSAFMAGGLPQPLPRVLTEEMTGSQFPDPYYSWKRMAERLLIKASMKSHFSYSIVRPALVYGPNAEWLVPMLRTIRRFGKYYLPLPNGGTALLGTVHVLDAANTIASAAWSRFAKNQIVHAVDNGGTTYRDWIRDIAEAGGWKVRICSIPVPLVYAAARGADFATSVFGLHYGATLWAQVLTEGCGYSNEKMKQIVGKLKNPAIHDGIPGMMDWFKKTHA